MLLLLHHWLSTITHLLLLRIASHLWLHHTAAHHWLLHAHHTGLLHSHSSHHWLLHTHTHHRLLHSHAAHHRLLHAHHAWLLHSHAHHTAVAVLHHLLLLHHHLLLHHRVMLHHGLHLRHLHHLWHHLLHRNCTNLLLETSGSITRTIRISQRCLGLFGSSEFSLEFCLLHLHLLLLLLELLGSFIVTSSLKLFEFGILGIKLSLLFFHLCVNFFLSSFHFSSLFLSSGELFFKSYHLFIILSLHLIELASTFWCPL